MQASLIRSDKKSCPTFAISVTSLRKFCKSMNLLNPTKTHTKQFWFGSGSSRSRLRFEFYIVFLHVSSSSVRLPSLAPNTSTCMGFSRRNKIPRCRVAVHTLWEKGIRFWHPDYDPDRAQKLTSSSASRHLSTRNISSKSMHMFLSNLANRQTDKRGQTHLPPPLSR